MALWLVRAGQRGEHEERFLQDNRIYATWEGLDRDLSQVASREELRSVLQSVYPDWNAKRTTNYVGQLWPFAHEMAPGDWVVVPSKKKASIHFAEIVGPYAFDRTATDPYYHSRAVRWIQNDVPRSNFDQDLLYSFGAFMTICRLERNDAEERVRAMAARAWREAPIEPSSTAPSDSERTAPIDLERFGRDQIARLIMSRFKGDELERLVEEILKADGYTTWRSPRGVDRGVDLLAAPGSLGFGHPRICVQVKSQDSPVGREVLDQLIGTMQNVQADQGLLVSWGGFKSTVDREAPTQFFRVRLWDQDILIEELLKCYDRLDEDVRADVPLKRVWTVALPDEQATLLT